MALARTQYARSGDVDNAYQVIGTAPRDIVFTLDWASHLEVIAEQPFLAEFLTSLARFARVLWFDMRGTGMSGPVAEGSPVEVWMDDLAAVMHAAGSTCATLVAHGHAAQMAVLAAATHPERVTSLILINGYARFTRRRTIRPGCRLASTRRTWMPSRRNGEQASMPSAWVRRS